MKLRIPDLSGAALAGLTDRPELVTAVREVAARCDRAFPFLLLPVRIETRFARAELPVAGPSVIGRLATALERLAAALESLAGRQYATELPAGGPARSAFKREVEGPIVAAAEKDLDAVAAALAEAEPLLRDVAEGTPADARRVRDAVKTATAALAGAGATGRLRSDFHRERVTGRLAELTPRIAALLDDAGTRGVAAAEIFAELTGRDGGDVPVRPGDVRRPLERSAEVEVPRHRVADSAVAFRALREVLSDVTTPERVTEARRLVTEIAVLPDAWRDELLQRLKAAATPRGADVAALGEAIAALPVPGRGTIRPVVRPQVTRTVDQLRVRIFPDDVAVATHETKLTASELASGRTYHEAAVVAGGDEAARRAAWRALAAKHGTNRAAYIAKVTRPRRPTPPVEELRDVLVALETLRRRLAEVRPAPARRALSLATALDGAAMAVRALGAAPEPAARRIREAVAALGPQIRGVARENGDVTAALDRLEADTAELSIGRPPPGPDVPEPELRESTWSSAARAGLMPERFAVVTVTDGAVSHVAVGEPVPRDLALGPDPVAEPEPGATIPAALRWMVDYETARAAGMAVTLDVSSAEAHDGFDRIYVLGLGPEDTAVGAADRVAALFDGHHYAPGGLALLPVGTPTNVTSRGTAAYRSTDDPEVAFDVEERAGLVSGAAEPRGTDGGRLARALGVADGVLDHVAGAGGREIADAVTASSALWPATFGYALEELLGGVVGTPARDRLRDLATGHVLSRGTLPSLRAGPQPYGVLVTTAFSRWASADPFEQRLRDVLLVMRDDWTRVRESGAVPHAHSPGVTDPQQHVLRVLGLDAVAAGFEQRFSVNAARRGAGSAASGLGIGLPRVTQGEQANPAGAFALMQRFATVFEAAGLGNGPLLDTGNGPTAGAIAVPWADVYDALRTSRGYEVRLLHPALPLDVAPAPADIAARIDALVAASISTLDAYPPPAREPLLTMLLRQALLAELRDAALRIAEREGLLPPGMRARLGSSDLFRFRSGFAELRVSRWSVLLDSVGKVTRVLGVAGDAAVITSPLRQWLEYRNRPRLADYVDRRGDNDIARGFPAAMGVPGHADLLARAVEHAGHVARLRTLPPERLDQLLAEHLDVCSHRLDSWLLALPDARLKNMRTARPAGVHVGAFGWVEDLQPAAAATTAAAVPAVLDTDPTAPVRADPAGGSTGGFVHAPSLNHAVTAAVLRAGYIAQRTAGAAAARRMAVNLGSRRTRSVLRVLDGIAAGNELGALLGYQFERDLHDGPLTADGAALDVFIGRLRRAFPSAVPVGLTGAGDDRAERLAVDGLALLQRVQAAVPRGDGTLLADLRAGGYARHPYGLVDTAGAMLPDRSDGPALEAVLAAVDRMADTVDALGDLVLAEGVYQLVQGNHARAAVALSALATGTAPPRPEVVDTPVPGRRVTHRVLVQLPPRDARNAGAGVAPGWGAVPATPRSAAEPTLNAWLGTLLGPPGATRIQVVTADGTPYRDVTLTMFGLQPVDLLALVHDGFEEGLSELAARAIDAVRPIDVRDGEPGPALEVDLERGTGWPVGVRALPEAAALLESAAGFVTAGRAADAGDYLLADTAPATTPGPSTVSDVAGGVDLAELGARADAAIATLAGLAGRLVGLLSDGAAPSGEPADDPAMVVNRYADTYRGGAARGEHLARLDAFWLRRDDVRDACLAAGACGVSGVTPPVRWTTRDQVATELLEAAEAAYVGVTNRLAVARRAESTPPGTPRSRDVLLGVLRAAFGESLPVLPLFAPRNAAELGAALAADLVAEPAVAVSSWLHGAGAVREPVAALTTTLAIAEAFGTRSAAGRPVQLPVIDGDAWLAEALPATTPPGDRIALAVLGDADLDPDGPCAGLLVDTWTEVVPGDTVTTGLAFRYDNPDATPPQCLLLAVPPDPAAGWRWEDLLATLHETLELAKDRAVEPEHLRGDVYGQLLPALVGEIPPNPADWGPDPQHRVVLDFAAARPAPKPS